MRDYYNVAAHPSSNYDIGRSPPTKQVQQLGALVAGELENLKVAPLSPALASSDLTRWDVLQAG
jgi:hypothetical protein